MHNASPTVADIFVEIQDNLYEENLKWYTEYDIKNAIQDAYNYITAILTPIEYSTLIPKIASPYYNIAKIVPDFMYVAGIYNPTVQDWLQHGSFQMMKHEYQTFFSIGEPRFFDVIDFQRVLVWPYLTAPSGVLFLAYKAQAPKITDAHIPILPHSVGAQLLECFATAELLEQAREFNKARIWWNKLLAPRSPGGTSLWDQAAKEIKNLARLDREMVLEPYRWIFHGGVSAMNNFVDGEIPQGTIDGVNNVFVLNQVPTPTNSLVLTRNGQIYYRGEAYELNGSTITINPEYIPLEGDFLRAWYRGF